MNSGKGELLYYEYDFTSSDKQVPLTRNYGCRVDFEVDLISTSITKLDGTKEQITEKGKAPASATYRSLATKLIFKTLKTLG